MVENPPAIWKTGVRSQGLEDTLEMGTATPTSILAWKMPWKRSLVWYYPKGSQRIRTAERLAMSPLSVVTVKLNVCLNNPRSFENAGFHLVGPE